MRPATRTQRTQRVNASPARVREALEEGRQANEGQEPTGQRGGAAVNPLPKLAEAVKKKLKTATQVENISLSAGVQVQGVSEEAKAVSLAKLTLLYYGYGEEETELDEASAYWGLGMWELWQSKNATVDWNMVTTLCKLTVVVVSSAKEARYPAGATADPAKAMFVAKGANDFYFVALHPSRRQRGGADAFVEATLRKWEEEKQKRIGPIVTLQGSDEEEGHTVNAGKRKKDDRNEKQQDVAGKKQKEAEPEDDENNFEVMEVHPVLESWGQFDVFKQRMRAITTRKKQIVWTEFISEEIKDSYDMVHKLFYDEEFAETKLTKTEFLRRSEEIANFEKNGISAKDRGEPRLFEDPEEVAEFAKDYKAYLKREGGLLSDTEKCEKLLRAIDDKHREWTIDIRKSCKLFQGEGLAARRLILIFQRLESLAEAAIVAKKGNIVVDKTQVKNVERGVDTGPQNERGLGRGRNGNYERRGYSQQEGYQNHYQPMWQGMSNSGFHGLQPQSVFQTPFAGGAPQQQPFPVVPMNYATGAGPYHTAGVTYPAGGMTHPGGGMTWPTGMGYPAGGVTFQNEEHGGTHRNNSQGVPGLPPGGGRGAGGGLPRRQPYGGQQQHPYGGDLGSKYKCFNCDEHGHLSTQCTKPKRCKICGSTNHLSYTCDGSGPKRNATPQEVIKESPQEEAKGTQQQQQYVPATLGGRAGNKVSFNQPHSAGTTPTTKNI
jgi:hypothetical protein